MHEHAPSSLTEQLSLEEEKEVRLYLLEELKSIIKKYASYYASDKEEPTPQDFFAWIKMLGEGEMYPSDERFDEQILAQDVRRFEKLYKELANIALKKPIGKDVQETVRDQLRENQRFIADVVYVQPEFEDLKHQFPAFVNPFYNGNRFDPIERCKDVSKESRAVVFEYYVHMDNDALIDEVLVEMDRLGLRPALYEELLCFDLKYCNEKRERVIVALGSKSFTDGERCFACLWSNNDDPSLPSLGLFYMGQPWSDDHLFLAVRKER